MSRTLVKSLNSLQVCERRAAQTCASQRAQSPFHREVDLRITPAARRPFSASTQWRASQMGRAIKPSGRRQSSPSMSVAMAQQQQTAMRTGQIPDDIGLLPDTFIKPHGKNLPSWIGDFWGRWRLENKRMGTRRRDWTGNLWFRYFAVHPRPRLRIRTIPGVAVDLQKQMYTHFANGSLAAMEGRICEGLMGSLRARISKRAPNTSLRWTRHQLVSRPKLVSYKAAIMPGPKGETKSEKNGVVQAVVRIHSLQSLQHVRRTSSRDQNGKLTVREVVVDAQGREVAPVEEGEVPKDAKEGVEYLVVQKSLRRGKEGPWMVWGDAAETTLEQIRLEDRKAALEKLKIKKATS